MRQTQPMTAEENAIDLAMRKQNRTHVAQDRALNTYRLAVQTRTASSRSDLLERCADLLLEGPSC